MCRFLVLKRLVVDECLVSWFQTPLLQILRVRLDFAVNCSAPFASRLLVLIWFSVLLAQFGDLMNVSVPGLNFVHF